MAKKLKRNLTSVRDDIIICAIWWHRLPACAKIQSQESSRKLPETESRNNATDSRQKREISS